MSDIAQAEIIERQIEPTLYITDAELIRRMGVPEKIARATIRSFDNNPIAGFPPKQPLFGDRRYWPAVKAYLDRLNKVHDAPENRKRA